MDISSFFTLVFKNKKILKSGWKIFIIKWNTNEQKKIKANTTNQD